MWRLAVSDPGPLCAHPLLRAPAQGSCKTVTLSSGVRAVEQRSDWLRFQINLQAFNWFNTGAITGKYTVSLFQSIDVAGGCCVFHTQMI